MFLLKEGWINRAYVPACLLTLLLSIFFFLSIYFSYYNRDIYEGDVLAPFSMVDIFLHGEKVDISRQQPYWPVVIGAFVGLFVEHNASFLKIFSFANVLMSPILIGTAFTLYLIARSYLSVCLSLICAFLLLLNVRFFLNSTFLNLTFIYGLLFNLFLLGLIWHERGRAWGFPLIVGSVAIAVLTRWEALLLCTIAVAWIYKTWRSGGISKIQSLTGTLVISSIILIVLAVHIYGSDTPGEFLNNTNTFVGPFSFFGNRFHQNIELLIKVLSWKNEKLIAFASNMTLVGLCIAVVGIATLSYRDKVLLFPLVYWIGYELVMFLYTIVMPVGDDRYLVLKRLIQVHPVDRYYHIFTPWLTLMMVLGIKYIFESSWRFRHASAAIIGVFLSLYIFWNLSILLNTGIQRTQVTSTENLNFRLADEFRTRDIRNKSIIVLAPNDEGTGWRYNDKIGGIPFLFAIMSGANVVNCAGKDLRDPNSVCTMQYGPLSLDGSTPPVRKADYFLLIDGSRQTPRPAYLSDLETVTDLGYAVILKR